MLPSVTGPLENDEKQWEDLARQLIWGADAAYVDRRSGEDRPAIQLIQDFVRNELRSPQKE
jgi:hypothetical protein